MEDYMILVWALAAVIGIVALFAVLKLFAISRTLESINEYVHSIKENGVGQGPSRQP